MKQKDLSQLNDEALIAKGSSTKKTFMYDALIIGFLIGIGLYGTVKNGFGLLTFLPFIYFPIAGRNKRNRAEVKAEMQKRNLKA